MLFNSQSEPRNTFADKYGNLQKWMKKKEESVKCLKCTIDKKKDVQRIISFYNLIFFHANSDFV